MKYKLFLASTLLIGVVGVTNGTAEAQPEVNSPLFSIDKSIKLGFIDSTQAKPKESTTSKKTKKHTVVDGDNLTKIAKRYNVSIKRLYYKNKSIKHLDMLQKGVILEIPEPSEKLKVRLIPSQQQTSNQSAINDSGAILSDHNGLKGSLGSVSPYGNCVNEPGVNNPGWGNPIDWPALTNTPTIGATALWNYNHTGVVTGIWSNGDIEVRHQNYGGGQTRFSPSEFRGYR